MLKDEVRTLTYRNSMWHNKHLFKVSLHNLKYIRQGRDSPNSYQDFIRSSLPVPTIVIDRKRIFLFWPKTNIRHKAVNIAKVSICIREKIVFLVPQRQVAVDGHDLWATETYMHKKWTASTKSFLSRGKYCLEMKSYYSSSVGKLDQAGRPASACTGLYMQKGKKNPGDTGSQPKQLHIRGDT
jgi:hypothetical protein